MHDALSAGVYYWIEWTENYTLSRMCLAWKSGISRYNSKTNYRLLIPLTENSNDSQTPAILHTKHHRQISYAKNNKEDWGLIVLVLESEAPTPPETTVHNSHLKFDRQILLHTLLSLFKVENTEFIRTKIQSPISWPTAINLFQSTWLALIDQPLRERSYDLAKLIDGHWHLNGNRVIYYP